MIDDIKQVSKQCKYVEELYDIPWKIMSDQSIPKKIQETIKIGLFNFPCAGFGDIIVCKTMYDYLRKWYPHSQITLCSTAPGKFRSIGIKDKITPIKLKENKGQDIECLDYDKLKVSLEKKFDMMIIIPIINKSFNVKIFRTLVPYSNMFNTFTMSEYNGEYPPYTYPIGVGDGHLGMLFNDLSVKKQTMIKNPYSLVYIQPQPEWGIHSKYCFLSFLEMTCKKYRKHRIFEMIIPEWIEGDLQQDSPFYYKAMKIVKKYYSNVSIKYPDVDGDEDIVMFVENQKNNDMFMFRADILPQPRETFISLMKGSEQDILVTGDQSITDVISCCRNDKNIWYQIAPWKQDLAYYLSKELPNKTYETFKTSCGTIKSLSLPKIKWDTFFEKYDFRIFGKLRTNQIMRFIGEKKKHKILFDTLLYNIDHSRYLETAQKKISEM